MDSKNVPLLASKDLKAQRRREVDSFLYGLLAGVLSLGFIFLVMGISMLVKNSQPEIGFGIESASLSFSNLSITSPLLPSQWTINFNVSNPNPNTDLFYHNIEVSVLYRKELLSVTILEPFYQESEEGGLIKRKFDSIPVVVDDWVRRAIADDVIGSSFVRFDVEVRSSIRYEPISYDEQQAKLWGTNPIMTASCKDVKFEFKSNAKLNGMMPGPLGQCRVVFTNLEDDSSWF